MNLKKQFTEGLITNNPVLVQRIGLCSTMAITTMFFNGIGMGLSVLIILTCCNVVISAMRKVIPNDIRLAMFVVVIAGFVTIVDLLLQAYVPALSASLGVFIPLIVVNCIIIGRAEAFCQHEPVGPSFFDGIFQGIGYTLVLICMCVIRELLGSGTFGAGVFEIVDGAFRAVADGSAAGIRIFPEEFGATIMIMPFGGFLTLACLLAAIIVLAVMILPSIINVSETALRAVPQEYEEASLALGATKIETYFRVSLPAASSGVATAVVLGVGRAIGEAMAIIMVAGNVANMPDLFTSVRFLTTAIASEMSYASYGSLQRNALYSIGLVLFLFIMLINVILNVFIKNKKEA